MKHDAIAPIMVSDPEGAAHTGLGLSMGLATTLSAARFAMGSGLVRDMIDVMIDHAHRHIRRRNAEP